LGLIIGLQLVLGGVSGVMFAWLDRDAVDGVGSVRNAEPSALSPTLVKKEPTTWLGDYPAQDIYDVRAITLADRWVWRVELRDRVELRAIEDGVPVKVDEAWLRRMALGRYAGSGRLVAVTLQTQPDIASRASGPVWQAQFDAPKRTAMYF